MRQLLLIISCRWLTSGGWLRQRRRRPTGGVQRRHGAASAARQRLASSIVLLFALVGCARPPAPSVEAAAPLPTAPRLSTPAPSSTPALAASSTPAPVPSSTPGAPPLLGGEPAPPLEGELAMVTYSLDLYRLPGALPAQVVQRLGIESEEAITNGAQILGGGLSGRVAVRFEPPQSGACALRGITLSNQRTIRLFYAPETDPARVRGILAHELFHQLQHDYYGERDHRKADVIFLEGMAVWGSAAYFRTEDGRPLYQVRVQEALAAGELLPLTTSLEADCRTTTRNTIYNQWASFVEYLALTYGRTAIDAAYRSSTGRPAGSADYASAFGKPLAQLEQDWITWLHQQ